MKKVIAMMLLVAAMGLTGCKGEKKTTPAPPANPPIDTPKDGGAAPPAEPAK